MTIRHLDALLRPASVAVFGASERPGSVGATVWRNLRQAGFQGPLYAVNPRHRRFGDDPVYPDVRSLPGPVDLAVVCVPAPAVPGLVRELAAAGVRAAVVLTAGLDAAARQAMLDAARPRLMRILGPNCLGLLVPHLRLNASFSHVAAEPGELAFVSQSGALVTAMLDWARGRGIGFSHFISLGEHADVDFGDLLDYLASDPTTRAILLYVESIDAARKFMSAARAAARNKPVLVVKAGRSARGQAAAASHTGALAGSDAVYEAAIQRAGMLRVDTLDELFIAAETLARLRELPVDALTVLTNGGGAGVMAADAAERLGAPLATLSEATVQALSARLPANWSHGNPVDIIGDAPAQRYVDALQVLGSDPAAGAILFIHAPTAIVPSDEIAQALLPVATAQRRRLLSCWLGDAAVASARERFRAAGLAGFATPEDAVQAFTLLRRYRANQAQLLEAPAARLDGQGADAPDLAAVRAVVRAVLDEGRELLSEPEAKAVLDACRIPVVATRRVACEPEAARVAAEAIGYPVVLKILSRDLSHKSDVGGVALQLEHGAAVVQAAQTMLARIRALRPEARLEGFTVQAMVRQAHARELIVGASVDRVFGPVILFGAGGTAVERVADRALALPPLNEPLARALVARTRVARLLDAYRDVPAIDHRALQRVLVAVSQLLAEVPELAELDINPLLAGPSGVVALDARIRVSAAGPGGAAHFAIAPYPDALVRTLPWQGGTLTLRPIRPEDEAQHLAFLGRLDPEDIRLRVFHTRRSIERSELARLTQIDYDREIALLAVAPGPDGAEETLGVVRALCDPDGVAAEFGIVVRSDLKGQGLGGLLMRSLIEVLKQRGLDRLEALVLKENDGMLGLMRHLGFQIQAQPDDPLVMQAVLPLLPPA